MDKNRGKAVAQEGGMGSGVHGAPRDRELYFHTPGERAAAYPYTVLAGGRAVARRQEPAVRRKFNQHVLILTQQGSGQLGLRGRAFTCGPGSLAWLDTSREYSHGCSPQAAEWTYLWLGVRGFGLDAVFEFVGAKRSPVVAPRCSPHLVVCFREALDHLRRPTAALDALNSAAVAEIVAAIAADESNAEERLQRAGPMEILLQQVRANLSQRWSIADLGDLSGVSASQLHRRFASTVGSTPMKWLRRERMTLAKHLLVHSDAPVGHVAACCGYDDPFHFSRDFRRATGLSPTEFRRAEGY